MTRGAADAAPLVVSMATAHGRRSRDRWKPDDDNASTPAQLNAARSRERSPQPPSHPATWLFLIVSVELAARFAAAWRHTAPRTFPDEYIYASLARSLAAGDGLVIRGNPAHFPALLEPLLAAPLWLVGDTMTAYRLTQGLHAVAMSLAALPVYWLARRVGAPAWQALACGTFAVALPALVFSSYITADAVAYPLALGALAVGVAALDRPSRWNQVGFVALALLATLARVQYAVIPIAFAVAALVVARGRIGVVLRRHGLVVALFGIPILAAVALGPHRLLGYYEGVLSLDVSPATIVHWLGVDAMLLAFAAGIAVVPGGVAGLVTGFRRTGLRACTGRSPPWSRRLSRLVLLRRRSTPPAARSGSRSGT